MSDEDRDEEDRFSEIIDNFMRIFSNLFGFPYTPRKEAIQRETPQRRYRALDVTVRDKGDIIEVYMNAPGLQKETIKTFIRDGNLHVYGKREGAELYEIVDLKGKGKKVNKWEYVNGILTVEVVKKRGILH